MAVAMSALGRNGYAFSPAEVLPGYGLGAGTDILHTARGDHPAAVYARAGANIHDIIGAAHGVLVMLDNNEGVAQIAQPAERAQELFIVPLMQTNAGLIEDIQHTHQA